MRLNKLSSRAKTILIVFVVTICAIIIFVVSLMFVAKQSASDYRGNASKQLNNVINGKDAGVTVGLSQVWLGDSLSSDYKKANSSQDEYKELLDSTKDYIFVLNIHNDLIGQYNAGLKGDTLLDGEMLKTVNQYISAIKNRFPSEENRISTMDELAKKIVANSEFDSISTDLGDVLADNDEWLNSIRDSINKSIVDFQKKIN